MTTLALGSIQPSVASVDSDHAHVLHSHHYHAVLLRALYEAEDIDASALLARAARAAMADSFPPRADASDVERRLWVTGICRQAGLGLIDLANLREDGEGEVMLAGSYFASAWLGRYPAASRPICAATGAILSVALSTAYGRSLATFETACAAQDADCCTFRIRAVGGEGVEREPVRSAALPRHPRRGSTPDRFSAPPEVLFGRALAATDDGSIEAPGGPFVRLPAAFYAAVAHRFEREIPRVRGAKFGNLPGILLLEAAHRNGFHLFGELLRSAEWAAENDPLARSWEDQLQALLGAIRALGWGSWEVTSFKAGERLIVRIADSYEAVAHERLYGTGGSPRCYVARGTAAAVMNLLFRGEGRRGPALTASHYNELFRSPHSFRAVETRCRALGDQFCEVVANPLTL